MFRATSNPSSSPCDQYPIRRPSQFLSYANFIITHEPIFYNHLDRVDWLQDNPVYHAKRRLLDDHQITVWRFHDYWHSYEPDGIYTGLIRQLGWEQYLDLQANAPLFNIPPTTVGELAASLAHELNQPLAAILSNAQAAQRFLAGPDPDLAEIRGALGDIISDDRRAGEVIRRMRGLLKRGQIERRPDSATASQ